MSIVKVSLLLQGLLWRRSAKSALVCTTERQRQVNFMKPGALDLLLACQVVARKTPIWRQFLIFAPRLQAFLLVVPKLSKNCLKVVLLSILRQFLISPLCRLSFLLSQSCHKIVSKLSSVNLPDLSSHVAGFLSCPATPRSLSTARPTWSSTCRSMSLCLLICFCICLLIYLSTCVIV